MKKRKNKDDPSGWRSSWGRFFGDMCSVSHFPSFCFHCEYVLPEPREGFPTRPGARFGVLRISLRALGPLDCSGERSLSSTCCSYLPGLWLYGLLLLTPPSTPGIMNIASALFLISRYSHVGTGHTSQRCSLACPRGGR